jgi:YHS domain-containing protein
MKSLLAAVLLAAGPAACAERPQEPEGPVVAYDPLTGPVRVAIDPVSHDQVFTDRAWKTVYRGRAYYFRSSATLARFEADPDAFLTPDGQIR